MAGRVARRRSVSPPGTASLPERRSCRHWAAKARPVDQQDRGRRAGRRRRGLAGPSPHDGLRGRQAPRCFANSCQRRLPSSFLMRSSLAQPEKSSGADGVGEVLVQKRCTTAFRMIPGTNVSRNRLGNPLGAGWISHLPGETTAIARYWETRGAAAQSADSGFNKHQKRGTLTCRERQQR